MCWCVINFKAWFDRNFYYNGGMNKFNLLILVFAVIGFFAYRNLKQTYKKFEKEDSTETKEALNIPSQNLKTADSRLFYYINVDRFIDGNKENNKNINLNTLNSFHGGDIIGIVGALDYLSKLGVTDIVLSPLNQQITTPTTQIKIGNNYMNIVPFSGMYSESVETMEPRFGNMDELTTFINEANKKNIFVHLTLNLNSVHLDSLTPFSPKKQSLFRQNAQPCDQSTNYSSDCALNNTIDYNHNDVETTRYLYDVLNSVWLSKGFKGVFLLEGRGYYQSFLSLLNREIKKSRGEDYLQTIIYQGIDGSELNTYKEKELITHLYSDKYSTLLSQLLKNETNNVPFHMAMTSLISQDISHHIILAFSHYNQSFASLTNNNSELYEKALAITFSLGASPLFVDGDEFGVSRTPQDFKDFPWGRNPIMPGQGQLQNITVFKTFNQYSELYKKYNTSFVGQYNSIPLSVRDAICFEKRITRKPNDYTTNSITCVNLSNEDKSFELGGLTSNWQKGALNIIDGHSNDVTEGKLQVSLAPHQSMIFIPKI